MRRPALALLLGCLLLVAGVSALDGYDYYQTIEYVACDQEIYQQDVVIHRTTGTAYNETAGGLEIWHIFVGEHCREDYGDIRFTNSTGAELAYYLWPDYSSESAWFTVRLEGADAAGGVVIWYGNAAAATTSAGNTTFEVFDGFEEGDLSSWELLGLGSSNSVTISTEQAAGGDRSMKIVQAHASSYYVCARRATPISEGVLEVDFYDDGDTSALKMVRLMDGENVLCGFGVWTGTSTSKYVRHSSAFSYTVTSVSRSVGWHKFRAVRSGSTITFYIDGTNIGGYAVSGTWGAFQYEGYTGGTTTFYVDNSRVRTYSATPPAAITFSGEQETAAPPVTAFTATPTAGLAPLTVQFTDTSTGSPTAWAWTFGDGGTSSEQNPQHTYTAPGLYTVTLTATNEYGSDEEIRTDYITVYGPVTAQFTANVTGGTAPVAVQFTDLSTGGPTAWSWSFGDGNTSAAQNPVHTYTTAGTHTVTLTASHPYDSDTETKTAYITVAVLQPFPGLTLIPRDLTGNGLYTDINGNNRLDYNDLTVFFQYLAWAKTAQPIACFDFNGNGWLDYNDVITLFTTITGEHP